MYNFIFVQGLAIFFLMFWTISYHLKKRRDIMMFQLIGLFLLTMHLFLLKAYIGSFLTFLGAIRHLIFSQKDRYVWVSNPIVLMIFILFFIIITAIGSNNFFDLFALLGSVLASVSSWQINKIKLKIFSIYSLLSWIIYHSFVESYGGILSNSIMMASAILSLIKES